jgi:hypothetical protein
MTFGSSASWTTISAIRYESVAGLFWHSRHDSPLLLGGAERSIPLPVRGAPLGAPGFTAKGRAEQSWPCHPRGESGRFSSVSFLD